jgi:putative membrane-bound dehydrogenase-like protein
MSLLIAFLASTTFAQQPAPRTPADTIKSFHLPKGFTATLFAGEPDLTQPIGFTFDDRGRLYVAENLSYPNWKPTGHDRIVIYEDTNNDGHFDKKTVFYDKLNYVTGLEFGFGGVWVVSPPNLLFIPDKNADDKPDAPPIVLLDGFGHQGVHNIANGIVWGPDGWLYGTHGGTSNGKIGAPNTSDKDRIFFDGGVWRYHPTKHLFESVMEGTTNPWGLDFDQFGQGFIPNSVTPHLYQVIMGAHVERRVQGPNSKYAYGVINSVADHLHWTGATWTDGRGGPKQIILGGGHAHCGLMIYQGGAWPEKYNNQIFINNVHGDRMNMDMPQRKGSGYLARHGQDFLTSDDPWYMALHVKYGPDGQVYVSDWYDTGECHTKKPHTENGRIYKISYQRDKDHPANPWAHAFNLALEPSDHLLGLIQHPNAWSARHAQRLLQERGPDPAVHAFFTEIFLHSDVETERLHALWGLHVTSGDSPAFLIDILDDKQEWIRAWAIQLLTEDRKPNQAALKAFAHLAEQDPSPLVRLFLASAMTRIAVENRWPTMTNLIAHAQDITDQNLPNMYWYALEPMTVANPKRALTLAMNGKIPTLREKVTRRIAEMHAPVK